MSRSEFTLVLLVRIEGVEIFSHPAHKRVIVTYTRGSTFYVIEEWDKNKLDKMEQLNIGDLLFNDF